MPFKAVARGTKNLARTLLDAIGVGVIPKDRAVQLQELERDIDRLRRLPSDHLENLARAASHSKSQIGQDLFVLSQLGFMRGGYFVEFGATNGVDLSNSHLLEKMFGWNGILAEPATCWHAALRKNRNCHIDTRCVWRDSNSTLTFNEANSAELSTLEAFVDNDDGHREARAHGQRYAVTTVSLVDLLDRYEAPRIVDYLSIDTEGSELEVLKAFDFKKYQFNVITCEHNFRKDRRRIYDILAANGYIRRFSGLSRWDDWYVRAAIVPTL